MKVITTINTNERSVPFYRDGEVSAVSVERMSGLGREKAYGLNLTTCTYSFPDMSVEVYVQIRIHTYIVCT